MQELAKIMEEIIEQLKEEGCIIDDAAGNRAEEIIRGIIRKHMNDGWIPVERELPPNAKHKGALCPRYQVMTKYGVTEGWYNPDYEGWYILFWFMGNDHLKHEIDFERGTFPKVVRCENSVNDKHGIVIAWRPIPEPYRPERSEE